MAEGLFSGNKDLRTNDPSTVFGLKRALVKDIKDPDNLNRVQVTFVDETLDSPFADVMAWFAGDVDGAVGSVCIPQVGEEVLVGFLDGKINNPVILGGLYSTKFPPPLVVDQEKNEKMYIKTYGGMEITVDNTADSQKVEIKTKKEHKIELDDGENETLLVSDKESKTSIKIDFANGEIEIKADNKISFSAGDGDTMVLEKDNGLKIESGGDLVADVNEVKLDAGADIKLTASANLKGEATQKAEIKGGSGADFTSDGPVKVESSATAALKGSVVNIN